MLFSNYYDFENVRKTINHKINNKAEKTPKTLSDSQKLASQSSPLHIKFL